MKNLFLKLLIFFIMFSFLSVLAFAEELPSAEDGHPLGVVGLWQSQGRQG